MAINKEFYVVVMDKDRAKIMNYLYNAAVRGNLSGQLKNKLDRRSLNKVFDDFVLEHDKATHLRGWCDDPNCGVPKDEAGVEKFFEEEAERQKEEREKEL